MLKDSHIRAKIAEIIATASGSQRVYSDNSLDIKVNPKTGLAEFSENVAIFRFTQGVFPTPIIHGWLVQRISRESLNQNQCENLTNIYEILGFYESVIERTPTTYSTFQDIVDNVAKAFNTGTNAGTLTATDDSSNSYTMLHKNLQFYAITNIVSGETPLHLSGGNFVKK
jgi:hypothetical protein